MTPAPPPQAAGGNTLAGRLLAVALLSGGFGAVGGRATAPETLPPPVAVAYHESGPRPAMPARHAPEREYVGDGRGPIEAAHRLAFAAGLR